MKKALTLLLILIIANSIQSQVKIQGVVLDSADGEKIGYTYIAVLNDKDSIINALYSDSEGGFNITIENNISKIHFQNMGYHTIVKPINEFNVNEINNIVMQSTSTNLNEFVIVGEKSEKTRKFDRTVYTITKEKIENKIDIYDLLQTLPGVVADRDKKTVYYKGSVAEILIDNMPSKYIYPQLSMLDIKDILDIELIDRSSLYGGEGKGGIINIKMKKKNDFFGGFISTDFSFPIRKNKFENSTSDLFLNLSFKHKSCLFIFNIENSIDNQFDELNLNGILKNNDLIYIKNYYQKNSINSNLFTYILAVLINLKKTDIILGFYNTIQKNEDIINNSNSLILDKSYYDKYFYEKRNYNKFKDFNPILTINRKFNKDRELNITIDSYLHKSDEMLNKENYNFDYLSSFKIDSMVNNSTKRNCSGSNSFLKLLYNNPINEKSRINFNIFYNYKETFNDNNIYFVNDIEQNAYNQNKKIYYSILNIGSNYGYIFNKFKFDVGLNFLSNSSIDQIILLDSNYKISTNYNKLLPSIRLSYTFNETHQLNCGYSYFVEQEINGNVVPYLNKTSPLNWKIGNKDLQPESYNKYYFAYNFTKEKYNFVGELFYKNTKNKIERITYPLTPTIYLTKPENIASYQSTGIDLSAYIEFSKIFNLNLNSTTSYSILDIGKISQTDEVIEKQDIIGNRTNVVFGYTPINKKIPMIYLMLLYTSREINYSGYSCEYFDMNLILSKKFLNDKFLISFRVNNILNGIMNRESKENYLGINTTSIYKNTSDLRTIGIYMEYNFMSGKRQVELKN